MNAQGRIQSNLEQILSQYVDARNNDEFGKSHTLWGSFESIQKELAGSTTLEHRPTLEVKWSVGQGNWARVPWIAFLDSRETDTTQRGVYCVYLFRQDMTGVYLTYNQGVSELIQEHGRRDARDLMHTRAETLREDCSSLVTRGFSLDDGIDLRTDRGLGAEYEHSTIAYKLYPADTIPADDDLLEDLEAVVTVYDEYLTRVHENEQEEEMGTQMSGPRDSADVELESELERIRQHIAQRGFVFEPWQIAAYVAAVRTKPFVILAGVSGTGKSKLPQLVAEATGAECQLIPVRPNWTDSSDVLGYQDLQGKFRPGPLLRLAQSAEVNQNTHYVAIVDEMNLARVEYYFAEVLSRMEDRAPAESGGYKSRPLLNLDLKEEDKRWVKQRLPPNLAIVGTVNMDETTHSFSRKVLDRAFTLEFSDIDLTIWNPIQSGDPPESPQWPAESWFPRAIQIAQLDELSDDEHGAVQKVVQTLDRLNDFLVQAQLQVGYRTRDEAALFVLHARDHASSFVTRDEEEVDPLDLVLHMKVLPRIAGGSNAIRKLLLQLMGWAHDGVPLEDEQRATPLLEHWDAEGRPSMLLAADYPHTTARLCLMWDRLRSEGFTSFWL